MAKVTIRIENSLRTTISSDDHVWNADEPVQQGGENTGPDPYELLLSSLGACTALTLRLYADRKEWPLEAVDVELTHERQHLDDCRDCTGDEKGPYLDRIRTTVRLRGDLSEEQRKRLGEIARKCPVHRTLQSQPMIETVLAE